MPKQPKQPKPAKPRKPKARKIYWGRKHKDSPGQELWGLIPEDAPPHMLVRTNPMMKPASAWKLPTLAELPRWSEAKRIAIDIETHDPQLKELGPGVRRGGHIIGVSFAIEDYRSYYLPMRHVSGNLDPQHVLDYLIENAKEFSGVLVGANLPYDLDYLWEAGLFFPKVNSYLDVQIAEPLLDDLQDSYSLENIALRLGMPGKNEKLLREAAGCYGCDPKTEMRMLPSEYVGAYAEDDCNLPLKIARRQEKRIAEQGIEQVFELESKVMPVLLKMRRKGVRVDLEALRKVEQFSLQEQQLELDKIKAATGIRLGLDDVMKARALEAVLEEIGVECDRTASGEPNIDKKMLEKLKHPVATSINRARKFYKLRTGFADSVRAYMTNGRIHATFNQLRRTKDGDGDGSEGDDQGARYGRLSCTDPNLQQQPGKDPETGRIWRSIYIPEEGCQWLAADYSSQEPRLIAHYGGLLKCTGADAIVKAYNDNPDLDFHQKMSDITGVKRSFAKIIFLGLCYSMGEAKLCHSLGLPTRWVGPNDFLEDTSDRMRKARWIANKIGQKREIAGEEGARILDQFHQLAPFVQELNTICHKRAREKGCIWTLLRRKCRFPLAEGGGFDWTQTALNRLIQGSAADQTKRAMVEADRAGIMLQLQVHDEIDTSVENEGQAEGLAEIMRHSTKLLVPSKVDVELGASWGGSMK